MLLLRGATRIRLLQRLRRGFQYMLLLRGATGSYAVIWQRDGFQYMLLLRGATFDAGDRADGCPVSIHAPLARSNISPSRVAQVPKSFNTCSSCEEQLGTLTGDGRVRGFNTCSSCEEQPGLGLPPSLVHESFNTCSSCEEQLIHFNDFFCGFYVSIHAPLARSNSGETCRSLCRKFQYMLLLRGATGIMCGGVFLPTVSIHAPLARSNNSLAQATYAVRGFNTCSSCEEQPSES